MGLGGLAHCHCCCCCLNKLGSILEKTRRAHLNNLKRFVKNSGLLNPIHSNKARIVQQWPRIHLCPAHIKCTKYKLSKKIFKSFVKLLTKVTNWEALKTISSTTQISHDSWSSLKSLENIAGVANADDFFALFNCTYTIASWYTGNQRMICWFNCTYMYNLSFSVSPRAYLRCFGS